MVGFVWIVKIAQMVEGVVPGMILTTKELDRINRMFKIYFAFPEERQKESSLFEGGKLLLASE